jgi:DNA-binding transcriptional regulator YdaS (Cro superfamily)
MDVKTIPSTVKAIGRARDMIGGTLALAAMLQVSPSTVSEWTVGKRRVPLLHCPVIEMATDGQVTREELRPDVNWGLLGTPHVNARAGLESGARK